MQRIKDNYAYLDLLAKCTKKDKLHNIIRNADKELILAIGECILNCLNGNINIDETTKRKLSRHKHELRESARSKKKSSIKTKKQILVQSGGSILPILLPIVTQALSSLLFSGNKA